MPTATYRLQLNHRFGFFRVGEVAGYLKKLGISHLYLSPYLRSVKGSPHGYNIADYLQVNPELGGTEGHACMCRNLSDKNLGQVIDIVPNHMGVKGRENRMWWDVLLKGRASRYAFYFDIDWEVADPKFYGKVLLPVLGDHYGRCLNAGQIQLRREGTRFLVAYYEHEMPVSRETAADLLQSAGSSAESRLPAPA